jgi:hypothetical protein
LSAQFKFIKKQNSKIFLNKNLGNLEDNGLVCNADVCNFFSSSKASQTKSKKTTCKPNAITSQLTTFAITITIYPSFN